MGLSSLTAGVPGTLGSEPVVSMSLTAHGVCVEGGTEPKPNLVKLGLLCWHSGGDNGVSTSRGNQLVWDDRVRKEHAHNSRATVGLI